MPTRHTRAGERLFFLLPSVLITNAPGRLFLSEDIFHLPGYPAHTLPSDRTDASGYVHHDLKFLERLDAPKTFL